MGMEEVPLLAISASKSAPPMTIFADDLQKPELMPLLNSHNQTLSHYFTGKDLQLDVDLLRTKLAPTSILSSTLSSASSAAVPRSLQQYMRSYLLYIADLISEPNRILVECILSAFLTHIQEGNQANGAVDIGV